MNSANNEYLGNRGFFWDLYLVEDWVLVPLKDGDVCDEDEPVELSYVVLAFSCYVQRVELV